MKYSIWCVGWMPLFYGTFFTINIFVTVRSKTKIKQGQKTNKQTNKQNTHTKIDSHKATSSNYLLIMSKDAYNRVGPRIDPWGIVESECIGNVQNMSKVWLTFLDHLATLQQ